LNVSVICPVFNTEPSLIELAVRSVLDQGGPHHCEVILVDDCSTNPVTRSALQDAAAWDSRVQVIYQVENTGPGQARAAGISRAKYDWIGFIDSDDTWVQNKLEHAQAVLLERPDTRWIASSFSTLLPGGELRPAHRFAPGTSATDAGYVSRRFSTPELTRMLAGFQAPLGVNLFHKNLIAESGGFDPRLIYGEDWLFILRVSVLASMDHIEVETYVFNRQVASMMHSAGRLSSQLARSASLARRDPVLRSFRRQLRWYHYNVYKDAAMNNALNGRKVKGLFFAMMALSLDPREIKDLLRFVRLLPANGPALAKGLESYSSWEQVILNQFVKKMP
jgi:glycosyltransferase involved in cell wall biosynthesis